MTATESLITTHGAYRKLKSFQVAQLIYDISVRFCDRYIEKRSRTHDQMVQAARSGVQNVAEGSQASGTSKKTETVLDPACGTAGFLISSYKHILKANTDTRGNSALTPDEKGRLAQNFKGYDLSPDMVRISLVNLYIHGFSDPHIYEYDTLTSQDRWNEYADVILPNPPLMWPKGVQNIHQCESWPKEEDNGFLELRHVTIGGVQAWHSEQGRDWGQPDYGVHADRSREGRHRA